MAEYPLEVRDHRRRLDGMRVDCWYAGEYLPQGMHCQDARTCKHRLSSGCQSGRL